MLESIPKTPLPHVSHPPKGYSHVLNLSLNATLPTHTHRKHNTIDHPMAFRTFYSTQGTKKTVRQRYLSRLGRETSMENRNSIRGTPFTSIDIQEEQDGHSILHMQRHRYQHYLNLVSTFNKTMPIPQIKYRSSLLPNPQHSSPLPTHKQYTDRLTTKQQPHKRISFKPDLQPNIPSIVNIVVEVGQGRQEHRQKKDVNTFQNIFKNKRRLMHRYAVGQANEEKDDKLMEEGFRIRAVVGERRESKMKKGG